VTKFVIHTSLNICFAIFDDRPFKFYTKFKREEYKEFVYTMAHKWAWSDNVTKCITLHPFNYFCNSWRKSIQILHNFTGRITTTFIYKNLWIAEWTNFALCLRVLQIYMIILVCTRVLAHTSVSMSMFTLTASAYDNMRHWTDSVFVRTLSCLLCLHQIFTDFKNTFTNTISRKFAIIITLNIPPHLKRIATLPCEI